VTEGIWSNPPCGILFDVTDTMVRRALGRELGNPDLCPMQDFSRTYKSGGQVDVSQGPLPESGAPRFWEFVTMTLADVKVLTSNGVKAMGPRDTDYQ